MTFMSNQTLVKHCRLRTAQFMGLTIDVWFTRSKNDPLEDPLDARYIFFCLH